MAYVPVVEMRSQCEEDDECGSDVVFGLGFGNPSGARVRSLLWRGLEEEGM